MRVELVVGVVQFSDFTIQRRDCRVLVNQRQVIGSDAGFLLAGSNGAVQELIHDLDDDHYRSLP